MVTYKRCAPVEKGHGTVTLPVYGFDYEGDVSKRGGGDIHDAARRVTRSRVLDIVNGQKTGFYTGDSNVLDVHLTYSPSQTSII